MSSITDYTSVVSAGVGVASLLGGFISFVWVRVEVTNRRTRRKLAECEDRSAVAQHHRATMTTVIELLWQIAPIGAAKLRARRLLDSLQATDIAFPGDET